MGVYKVSRNWRMPVINICTAMAVSIMPIKRSIATKPRSPRNRRRPLERSTMIPEEVHASSKASCRALPHPEWVHHR